VSQRVRDHPHSEPIDVARPPHPDSASPRWWAIRRAQNLKPATYRCPFCDEYLPALSEHVLIVPEGDARRRRHAHTRCTLAARKAGRLPTQDEWLAEQPPKPGALRRLLDRLTG
jgi:hypothetical protein